MLRIAPVALILFGMSCSSRDGAPPVAPTSPPVAVADAAVAADAADADVAGRRLTAWLAMFNDGKRDEIIAFRERELSEELRKNLPDPDEIVERVTKQTYYDRVAAAIVKPAGMTGTASPIEGTVTKGRVVAYTREKPDALWTSAADTLPVRATSAGGGDSTVIDLIKFANALASHKLLDAERVELLTTGKVDTPRGKYAYGFFEETENGVRCVGHGGGAPGMNGDLAICDSGYTIAVLSNLDPPAASRISAFIKARLPAK